MEILYLSAMASQDAIEKARKLNPSFSSYAVQKFNRLVVEGLAKNNHQVISLSTFYMPGSGYYFRRHQEIVNDVYYRYITSPNFLPLRHIWLVLYCFFYVLFWGMRRKKQKVLMGDVLNISACLGATMASRLIGLKSVGIMTDMPGLMVSRSNSSKNKDGKKSKSFTTRVNKSFLANFTHYVFLTEEMNEAVNVNHHPYIVMEGLVDVDMKVDENNKKNDKRIVIYAGGLHERYGLRLLVEGFIQADVENSELWLYGSGPFVEELPKYNRQDSRVIYKGVRSNDEVVNAELEATLLVNPRPIHEEFTKYSFPSKNMEYMASGTPLLTTRLPGMPKEYYPYVFLFDEVSVENFASKIREVLSLPEVELHQKGKSAKDWILSNKNNINQTYRIIKLLNGHKV